MKRLPYLLSILLVCAACTGRHIDSILDAGESLIEAQPDSALAILQQIIAGIRNKDNISELAAINNEYYDNISKYFSEDFPNLKEEVVNFMTFTIAGLSPQAIALICNKSVQTIYTRRRRLISKIEESDSPNKGTYLRFLTKSTER